MNENLNLVEILKDCLQGTKLYSLIWGECKLDSIDSNDKHYPIKLELDDGSLVDITKDGRHHIEYNGECTIFPSKDVRTWDNFKPKNLKFDPKTLKPFDKVITKISCYPWKCNIFSYYIKRKNKSIDCYCTSENYVYDKCIPYNDKTKHLVGTTEEAPEYYRYWEE